MTLLGTTLNQAINMLQLQNVTVKLKRKPSKEYNDYMTRGGKNIIVQKF
jgi:hypothetical protein